MKNLLVVLSVLVCFTAISVFAEKVVLAKTDDVGLYKNEKRELYEKPLYRAKKNEWMNVVEEKGGLYKVRVSKGVVGWVERGQTVEKQKGAAEKFVFDDMEIQGWLDNPQAVYILDATDPNFKPVQLDKSFKDDLEHNIDREKSEEEFGLGGYPGLTK